MIDIKFGTSASYIISFIFLEGILQNRHPFLSPVGGSQMDGS